MNLIHQNKNGNFEKIYLKIPFDYLIKFGNFEFQCHKIVISLNSKFLSEKINDNSFFLFKEYEKDYCNNIINYLNEKNLILNKENIEIYLKIALELQLINLIEDCVLYNTSINNILKIIYNLKNDIISTSILNFSCNFFSILIKFDEFFQIKIEILQKILNSDFLNINSEFELIYWLINYLKFNNNFIELNSFLFNYVKSELLTEEESNLIWKEILLYPEILKPILIRRTLWSLNEKENNNFGLIKIGRRIQSIFSIKEILSEIVSFTF